MNIVITGSSGLIGTALQDHLRSQGAAVYPMLREHSGAGPFSWSPNTGEMQWDESIPVDAVINLAGAGIAGRRWTAGWKRTILESRIRGTRLLAERIAGLNQRPGVLISASAVGYYGDTGNRVTDESSPAGDGFLSDVCGQWEAAAGAAAGAGVRTVFLRTGLVLSPRGGMLRRMVPVFKAGLGGILGCGCQYMSWVSLEDVVHMIAFCLETDSLSGPVNLVSKHPVTNYVFTKMLGGALSRLTMFRIPEAVLKAAFGREMADELLLSGKRVFPHKLEDAGYRFIDSDLHETFEKMLC